MRLWLLQQKIDKGYDEAWGFVVRAESEEAARALIEGSYADGPTAGNEGPECWRDPRRSSCEELTAEGAPGVVMRDFLHG